MAIDEKIIMTPFFSFITDILFPRYCFGCGYWGTYVCGSCKKQLQTMRFDICPYCRKKSYFGLTHPVCKKEYGIDGLKSIYRYNDVVKKIIMQIKYRLITDALSEFFLTIPRNKMEELLFYRELSLDFLIVPVPLHTVRMKHRGFNQANEMARFFAQVLRFSLDNNSVIRKKNTKPQVAFKKPIDRYRNIVGAFDLADQVKRVDIHNKQFIIFDDVWTTGWTMKEVAKVLKKNGAEKVFALTLAR
ncbi:MAG TPA: ComF family protein [Patescibacteria group bacterium]|nr:ComF family protein [Patescibacteria group bacterium]